MYYLINSKPLSLKGKYNNLHFTGEKTREVRKPVQRGDVWCPRTSSKVNLRVLDSSWFSWHCKIKREDRSQALHPGRPLRVQLPKQRCGVSWSSLVHWLINLPGVHSRKGKVKNKGKIASSFFKRRKPGLPLPLPGTSAVVGAGVWLPRSHCSLWSKVAAQGSVHLTLLKSGASETVAYHKVTEVSVSCCVLPCTWHSESTCRRTAKMPAFFFFFLNPR